MSEVNEHAERLRDWAGWHRLGDVAREDLIACAAEIERLAARVADLEARPLPAPVMITFDNPAYEPWLAEQREKLPLDRKWLPIESAPRDGTRVELWDGVEAVYGEWLVGKGRWFVSPEHYLDEEFTHWRPEPSGPTSKGEI